MRNATSTDFAHIETLRARWSAGDATPEEIREVKRFLAARNNPSLSARDRIVGACQGLAFIGVAAFCFFLMKIQFQPWLSQ